MRDRRLSRRSLLTGAVGASAVLALPRVAVPQTKKGANLRLWILKTYVEPTNKAIEASAQRWATKHGGSVTVEYFTFEDMQTKYVAAIENKNTPDVGQLETSAPARFAGMGQLLDLSGFAKQIESQVGKPPANVAPVTIVDGKTWAIPWYIMAPFWYVWRDEFERALQAAVEQAANEAIAFEPTVVALTGVRVIGDRVLVGVLFADDAGKEMLEGLGQGGDDATDDVDVRPTKIDI